MKSGTYSSRDVSPPPLPGTDRIDFRCSSTAIIRGKFGLLFMPVSQNPSDLSPNSVKKEILNIFDIVFLALSSCELIIFEMKTISSQYKGGGGAFGKLELRKQRF